MQITEGIPNTQIKVKGVISMNMNTILETMRKKTLGEVTET